MSGNKKISQNGIISWCKNYLYYYKYRIIVTVVLIFALVVCTVQCCSKPKYDYTLVLGVGSVEFVPAQIEALEEQISEFGTDQNGDGKVLVDIIDCTYNEKKSSYSVVTSKRQKMQAVFMKQYDTLLFICDKSCFDWLESIREEGFMENLNLSEEDGRYLDITESSILKNAKENTNSGLTWPEELRISRRIVSGTLIEKEKEVVNSIEKADTLLAAIKANS